MSVRNLERMFKPRSVALIGASARVNSVGHVIFRNLRRAGFAGPIMPVNPHLTELEGLPAWKDVESLPAPPDLAIIATPPETVPGLIEQLGKAGTRAAVVITAGFAELGERGKALQQQTLAASRPYLLRLVGPNCVGIMVPGLGLDASFSHIAPARGDLAFVSQSGAMITAVLDWAAPRGIGFSHVVSLGDVADVDFGDMLDYLATDKGTRAILLYVEAIKEARKFMSAARAAARLKPVLVVKVGRFAESARAAASHTGALAGSDAVYDAAFRRAGMLRVGDMAELFDAVETLALARAPQGERLAILTNGGGPGVLATDALMSLGGKLATVSPALIEKLDAVLPRTWSRANPVDIIGDADGARYRTALSALLADGQNDAVLVMNCPTALAGSVESAAAVIDTVEKTTAKPRNVFTVWLGEQSAAPARELFSRARIPTYDTPDSAIRGFMHGVQYRRNQELMMETPAARPTSFEPDLAAAQATIGRALAAGRSWLEADEIGQLLAAYGIPFAAPVLAATPEEAAAAAARMGFPVALKIRSPDLTHKSDVGGVALNLDRAERVREAAALMLQRIGAARPQARLEGFMVQPMVDRPEATELILGMTVDSVFGPIVMFGQGGTAVEVIRDTALELPPLNEVLAKAQIARTRVAGLLRGYRDRKPADHEAIVESLIRVAELAADHPEIAEIDINPLLADAAGVMAIDARIRIARADARASRLSISPYPREFASEARLADGTAVALRPVRPEDEPMLQDIVAHMTQEDQRFRFFAPMRELPHQLAARLSQVDYAREMALLAQLAGKDTALGVARYSADPDNQAAEFAIAVRSDWKGRGLGHLLMIRLIAVARGRGIGALLGDVLRDNDAMIDLCRNLGFSIAHHPEDPAAFRVSLALAAPGNAPAPGAQN